MEEFNKNHDPVDGKFTTWQGGKTAATVAANPHFKAWFAGSKVVDQDGNPLRVFHGSQRPDRIGAVFLKSRATSGPSAFFTDDPEIASNYAKGKQDTSLESPDSYADWIKYTPEGSKSSVTIDQAWHYLSSEERAGIAATLPHVANTSDEGEELDHFVVGGPNKYGLSGKEHWDRTIREQRGNVLAAAVDIWLSSGALFGDERSFMDVLKLGKVPMNRTSYDDPNAVRSGVIPVYLSIKNPLVTDSIPSDVLSSLDKASRRQRVPKQTIGADQWDKRIQNPHEWMDELKADHAAGRNSMAWTTIPDWVTKTLASHGYDGVHDTGGKNGGPEHSVWVPFEPTQIKSAIGNKGKFNPTKKNISESKA